MANLRWNERLPSRLFMSGEDLEKGKGEVENRATLEVALWGVYHGILCCQFEICKYVP